MIVQSPMSVTGALGRVGKMWRRKVHGGIGVLWGVLLAVLGSVWVLAAISWTILFGILLVPWRVVRRGQRQRKMDRRRHEELLAASRRAE